ncbi:MAG: hypothetical protein ACD_78C00469G0004 [uncultured bacterium (gcode 4)]|uniref:Uncharacterized protein n=1 Tax=uncultured bacterium (gcode 4) TaxID=1234023 RepID=K1YVH9_9BACT|nr:MAG: hypothetical protein ACD_78C00469G0004 [uncultured bacterium (gcode 4)]
MKRFLIAILASTFLLPVCGSVLAFAATEISHHNGAHHSVQNTSSKEMHESDMSTMENNPILVDSLCEEHISNPSGIGCCDSSHANSKIGIWQKWETLKYVNNISVAPFFVSQDSIHEESEFIRIHPSTAPPPDKQSYASLVGIIKRLD